ncbi:MAG: helix-turn-helix domain-containing protein [Lachnospiraceae bacterium]|nr:helix-turn-helix domain-containing protein [Lachnospiraceae bacterium]
MKIADAKSFGETIRKRRKALHYTQAYLSECTGLSITFISDLEKGKPSIQLEKAIQVVNILGMDLLIEKRGD